ncbi:hypothetical protein JCM5296_003401 [Sporobolomyces johnsonii]
MAPHARLRFTPSSSPLQPGAFDAAGPISSLWPFPSHAAQGALKSSERPLPPLPLHQSPSVAPALDVTGPFSLHPGGGVLVGEVAVGITPGTFVGRAMGLGENGKESRGLWWPGRATPADSTYRDSLLLYDNSSRQVVAVLPLHHDSSPTIPPAIRPAHPPPPASTAAPPPCPLPSPPGPLSPGAKLAAYIDQVVAGIHPDPTLESLAAAERLEQARIARKAKQEEEENEELGLNSIDVSVSNPSIKPSDEELGDPTEHELKKLQPSFARLDDAMANLPPPTAARRLPRSLALSECTVSSFATFGSDRFVTADEFEVDAAGQTSRRSSLTPTVRDIDEGPSRRQEEDDATPTPSRFAAVPPASASAPAAPAPAFEPQHTPTNGNAVLLSFLGAPSVITGSSTASSRVKVTAHPLSSEQVSEGTEAGTIRLAEGEIAILEEGEQGWWSWLSGLWGSKERVEAKESETTTKADEDTAGAWFAWFMWPSSPDRSSSSDHRILSASTFTTSTASSLSLSPTLCMPPHVPSRRFGRASGERTSRLSLIYVDEEGWGQKAYVAEGSGFV